MVFSSQTFLFFFLPLAGLCVLIRSKPVQNALLLIASLIFYAWGEPKMVVLMVLVTLIAYGSGFAIVHFKARPRAKKAVLIASVVVILGNLVVFKYLNFLCRTFSLLGLSDPGIALPIGISFYTFQILSYVIDLYRGKIALQRNFFYLLMYVSFFPQLIAGPIVKYETVAQQIDHRKETWADFSAGCSRFIVGLGKKVLLSNQLAVVADRAFGLGDGLSASFAWLGALCYTLQIYYDFSGYSDMAVGLGRMLGFEFMRNFNYPYIAKSVTEFWRRWHISLGTWFREYLYIPLGGNRVSKPRLFFNLLVVWAATGIWHGASWNFLIWGLYFAVLLILEKAFLGKLLQKLPAALQHLYTLFLVLVSWAIFAVEDFGHMGAYLKAMFGLGGGLTNDNVSYYFFSFLPMLIIAAVASTPLAAKLWKRLPEKPRLALLPILLLAGLVFSTAYLVDATYNPFLYFRF